MCSCALFITCTPHIFRAGPSRSSVTLYNTFFDNSLVLICLLLHGFNKVSCKGEKRKKGN